jgi:diguanylate cyclase (GGDEF)-like protein
MSKVPNVHLGKGSQRLAFLGLIAWLSVCLLVAGLFPAQMMSFGKIWVIAGVVGLVSSVGLSQAVKSEIRSQSQLLSNYIDEARTDALTGLGNRRAFDVELAKYEAKWREGERFSLLLLDVDQFKSFNDTFGHQAGDEMLRAVADVLRTKTDDLGFATRYGGEEFAVMLPGMGLEDAALVAEALRDLLESHETRFRGNELQVTVSIGVADAQQSDTAKDLVVRADERMYDAKEAGRNCVRSANAAQEPAEHVTAEV